jgi:hypothetical protein
MTSNENKVILENILMCLANEINHYASSICDTYKTEEDDDLSPLILKMFRVMTEYLNVKEEQRQNDEVNSEPTGKKK